MRKFRLSALLAAPVLSLAFAFSPASVGAIGFEAAVGGTQQYPWGSMGYKGTALDLKNDLNYSRVNTLTARLKLELPLFLPNIYLTANPMRFEGTGTRGAGFRFNDKPFSGNAEYTTKLKLDHYDPCLFYGVPFLKTATADILNIEFGLNARIIDLKTEISQAASGLAESKSLTVGVPMGYVGIQVSPVDLIKVEAELRGIAYDKHRFVDASGRIKFKVLPLLFVAGGYKFQNIHVDQSDVLVDLMFGGPVLEIGLQY